MNKAIFWDFDGTLAKQTPKWSDALDYALERNGYNVSKQDTFNHIETGFTWHTPEKDYVDATEEKWWENLFKHLEKFYIKNSIPKKSFKKINNLYRDYILNQCKYELYEDAKLVLEKCKKRGYKNYILSNNFPELEQILKKLEILKYFEGCIISAKVGYEKPRIEIFELALHLANNPEKSYMIGDNPISDIKGAKNSNIMAILVNKNVDSVADYKCDNLIDILDII